MHIFIALFFTVIIDHNNIICQVISHRTSSIMTHFRLPIQHKTSPQSTKKLHHEMSKRRKTTKTAPLIEDMKGIQEMASSALLCISPTASLQIPTLSLRTVQNKKPTTIEMPTIGLGTYKFKKGSGDASKAVQEALEVGYRHVDTAFVYGGEQTEKEIGSILCSLSSSSSPVLSSIQRSDIFLTSKQWRAYHGYEQTLDCLEKSLKRLQTDYLDL